MKQKTALVVGGNGIIGRNTAEYLVATGEWNVLISSRSPLDFDTTATFVALDLMQENALLDQRETLAPVTHVFFAAYIERPTLAEQTATNAQLLKNLVDGIEQVAPNLEHITFIQGGKAYGAHFGLYKTPALETDARHFPPNFYYDQEDYLRQASAGKAWRWTAVRPDIVIGLAIGNPMNLATLIAVYASLCKELNVPFRFPGPPQAYEVLVNVTDVRLLAQGMEYVATQAGTDGEIYNITNGDIFRWKQLWPRFAQYFGVAVDEPQPFSLADYMADKPALWEAMGRKYNLAPHALDELVQWPFGDFIFRVAVDAFFDVNKLRRHGFHEMHVPSYDSFERVFDELKAQRIIPA
jgi:nucleoside-diphosphate-sugar epimerase